MISKAIVKQVQSITKKLIESSLQIDFNYVSDRKGKIEWQGYKDISFVLKNQPYEVVYSECIKERAFNFMLLDGAIIQMMYECDKNHIIKHRLAFYPKPSSQSYQDDPENFESNYYGNDLFSENRDVENVAFPIRFDYDNDKKKYVELDHSYSHLTLGNYKNCRIPISQPVTPNHFILFILRNFYFDKFKSHHSNDDFKCEINPPNCISQVEQRSLHLSVGMI